MTTTREDFARGIHTLNQYRDGCYPYDWVTDYQQGFFAAITMWISGAHDKSYYLAEKDWDAREGFRTVVAEYGNVRADETDEYVRGYQDALMIFREAKGL